MNDPYFVCPECDTHFDVTFNRNPVYNRIYYCPFCGVDISVEELQKQFPGTEGN